MITLDNLMIGYNKAPILDKKLDFCFSDGYVYGVLAPSGKGKSTLLKTISGLLKPVSGKVTIDGSAYRNTDGNPVFMMHQKYTNFDWLSCLDNILIAQRDKKLRKDEDARKFLDLVGLSEYENKYPSMLSGGMQQRLSLARVLYIKPKYLLMDEPLSALDDVTRDKMQKLVLDIHRETGNTILLVTHSKEEANKMCDEVFYL